MDAARKKQLQEEYRNRRPEMGVISYRCLKTGESFLGISKDTRADFNGIQMRLSTNSHPNKKLLALWKEHGEAAFAVSVLKVLEYDDPLADHSRELEALREACLLADPKAEKLWK